MRFVDFTNNRFEELSVAVVPGQFSVPIDGEVEGLKSCLGVYRFFVKLLFIPKILTHFVLVNLRIAKKPEAPMSIMMAQEAAMKADFENKRLQKLGKKVGMNQVPNESGQ